MIKLLIFLLIYYSGFAFALPPPSVQIKETWKILSFTGASQNEVCARFVSSINAPDGKPAYYGGHAKNGGCYGFPRAGGPVDGPFEFPVLLNRLEERLCDPPTPNSVLSGDICVCKSGFIEKNNSCVANNEQDSAQSEVDDLNKKGDQFCTQHHQVTGMSVCSGGFVVKGSVIAQTNKKNSDGSAQQCIQGPFTTSGFACDPNAPDTNVAGDGTCKGGKVPGEVNGVTVCVTPGTITTSGGTKTTNGTNSNGNPTTTTVDKTTKCDGSQCTTTTKTTTVDTVTGISDTREETETKDKTTFCQENPQLSICKNSSFSGACGGSFSCDGDAVQCAISKEIHQRNCQLWEKDREDNIYERALRGEDEGNTQKMKEAAASAAVDVGTLDFAGKGWNRSCPEDPRIPLPWTQGAELVMPWSKMCGPLGMAADIAVLLTALGCVVWVVGARD